MTLPTVAPMNEVLWRDVVLSYRLNAELSGSARNKRTTPELKQELYSVSK